MVDVQTLRAFDLRNDLVAAALVAKAVDVVAAKHRREVSSDLLQIQTECGHLVAVEDDLRLRLVVLQVGVREHEYTALERFGDELVGEFEEFSGFCGGRNDKLDGEVASAGKRRRRDGNDLKPRNRTGLRKQLGGDLFGGARTLVPRLGDQSPEAACRAADLEGVRNLGRGPERLVDFVGEKRHLIERGIGGGLHDPEDESLVLVWRQFVLGEHEERRPKKADDRAEGDDRPAIDYRQRPRRACKHSSAGRTAG